MKTKYLQDGPCGYVLSNMRAAIRSISKKSFTLHCHYDIHTIIIVVTKFCISSLYRKIRGERTDQRKGDREAEREGRGSLGIGEEERKL